MKRLGIILGMGLVLSGCGGSNAPEDWISELAQSIESSSQTDGNPAMAVFDRNVPGTLKTMERPDASNLTTVPNITCDSVSDWQALSQKALAQADALAACSDLSMAGPEVYVRLHQAASLLGISADEMSNQALGPDPDLPNFQFQFDASFYASRSALGDLSDARYLEISDWIGAQAGLDSVLSELKILELQADNLNWIDPGALRPGQYIAIEKLAQSLNQLSMSAALAPGEPTAESGNRLSDHFTESVQALAEYELYVGQAIPEARACLVESSIDYGASAEIYDTIVETTLDNCLIAGSCDFSDLPTATEWQTTEDVFAILQAVDDSLNDAGCGQ